MIDIEFIQIAKMLEVISSCFIIIGVLGIIIGIGATATALAQGDDKDFFKVSIIIFLSSFLVLIVGLILPDEEYIYMQGILSNIETSQEAYTKEEIEEIIDELKEIADNLKNGGD